MSLFNARMKMIKVSLIIYLLNKLWQFIKRRLWKPCEKISTFNVLASNFHRQELKKGKKEVLRTAEAFIWDCLIFRRHLYSYSLQKGILHSNCEIFANLGVSKMDFCEKLIQEQLSEAAQTTKSGISPRGGLLDIFSCFLGTDHLSPFQSVSTPASLLPSNWSTSEDSHIVKLIPNYIGIRIIKMQSGGKVLFGQKTKSIFHWLFDLQTDMGGCVGVERGNFDSSRNWCEEAAGWEKGSWHCLTWIVRLSPLLHSIEHWGEGKQSCQCKLAQYVTKGGHLWIFKVGHHKLHLGKIKHWALFKFGQTLPIPHPTPPPVKNIENIEPCKNLENIEVNTIYSPYFGWNRVPA